MEKTNGSLLSLLDKLVEKAQVLGLQEGLTRGGWYKEGEVTPTGEEFFATAAQMKREITALKAEILDLE